MKMRSLLLPLVVCAAAHVAQAYSLYKEVVFEYQYEPATTNAPPETPAKAAEPQVKKRLPFGAVGQDWFTIGGGVAHDLSGDGAFDIHAAWSTFVIDDVEFSLELAGWYFAQKGSDALGINPQFVFRWHFHKSQDNKWSLFAEGGIGLLLTSDNVPDGGTSFDFTPRVGAGFTRQLDDSGLRFQMGVRWAHISNARINGDSRNPSRDSVMIFAGVMMPF